jgi:hypothetical protein
VIEDIYRTASANELLLFCSASSLISEYVKLKVLPTTVTGMAITITPISMAMTVMHLPRLVTGIRSP